MPDLPTPTPTTQPPAPEASDLSPAKPTYSDLTSQIDTLLAAIDSGSTRLEEHAATLTSPSAPAAASPATAPDIEKELNYLLHNAGASVPNGAAPVPAPPQPDDAPSPPAPPKTAGQPADTTAQLSSQIDALLNEAAPRSTGAPTAAPAEPPPAPKAGPSTPPAPQASPSLAATPAPVATPSAPASAPVPTAPALSERLASTLARVLTPLSAPLASQPKALRDSLGWVAANTLFLGACLWVYIEFFRPDPKVAHSHGAFDFAHDQVPPAPDPDHAAKDAHGPDDPKAASDSHGAAKKSAAKKPDATKADPHAKAPAKGAH